MGVGQVYDTLSLSPRLTIWKIWCFVEGELLLLTYASCIYKILLFVAEIKKNCNLRTRCESPSSKRAIALLTQMQFSHLPLCSFLHKYRLVEWNLKVVTCNFELVFLHQLRNSLINCIISHKFHYQLSNFLYYCVIMYRVKQTIKLKCVENVIELFYQKKNIFFKTKWRKQLIMANMRAFLNFHLNL